MRRPGLTLVTGAGGFIGRRLVELLRISGEEVVGWVRAEVDLTDVDAVRTAMQSLRPTTVFHLAASAPVQTNPDWGQAAIDTAMVDAVVNAMPSCCRLVQAGSVSEYGRSGHFDEADARTPRTLYGFAKAAATDRALALAAMGRGDIRVARLFGVYGPGETAQRLLPHLVAHLAAGRAVPLAPRGQVRDLVYVDDVCDALIQVAEADTIPLPIINIGTGTGVRVQHICETVADMLGADRALLSFGAIPRRAIDEDSLVARVERFATIAAVPSAYWVAGGGRAADYVRWLEARDPERAA